MTLIELISFLVCISIGVATSRAGYHFGGLWLGIPGFILGFLVIPFLAFLYDKYRKWAYPGEGRMVDCSCGSHTFKIERYGYGKKLKFCLICEKCGARYEKRRHKVWIYDNNEKRIYKQMVKFKGWM